MKAVVQRVSRADVKVDGETIGEIGPGLLVLLGVGREDGDSDIEYLAGKVAGLRIFPDDEGKMNRSVMDIGGEILVVSQFTLYGDVSRGKRPSFIDAAPPELADTLYQKFVAKLQALGVRKVATGKFQAMMDVTMTNAGPVTILVESRK